ncbi:uncharacterized protein GBIM_19415 [Gryllus bimaculatus]|nr:uncharacterized protein GBIM_19415 [Gryllus bimaculatus]
MELSYFTQDPELRRKWIIITKRKDFVHSKYTKLCYKPFQQGASQVRPNASQPLLNLNAAPSIFDFPEYVGSSKDGVVAPPNELARIHAPGWPGGDALPLHGGGGAALEIDPRAATRGAGRPGASPQLRWPIQPMRLLATFPTAAAPPTRRGAIAIDIVISPHLSLWPLQFPATPS